MICFLNYLPFEKLDSPNSIQLSGTTPKELSILAEDLDSWSGRHIVWIEHLSKRSTNRTTNKKWEVIETLYLRMSLGKNNRRSWAVPVSKSTSLQGVHMQPWAYSSDDGDWWRDDNPIDLKMYTSILFQSITTDWSVRLLHNFIYFYSQRENKLLPIFQLYSALC